ncbi:MAG: prepilin-type N-terminal cleavage/methylation domain-containing protein [Acidobacteria bacterium]|nr:prepilin-type N-terminal cleavage/methylation domain-containing protein [Acidobacteriota bacterium]
MRTAQPALACRVAQRPDLGESGFTLIEFMIAAAIMTMVLGGTVMLATQIQQAYGTQLDDVAVEQEARYALDWIARDLRSAGSDPYDIIPDNQEVQIDPDGVAPTYDSILVQADINPPDGVLDDPGENITIAFDSVNTVITREDPNAADPAAQAMTEAIFTDLRFTYLDTARAVTTTPELVAYVQVQVTAQSRARNPITGGYTTSTLATEVRLRTR